MNSTELRLSALSLTSLLDTLPEPEFDTVARLAQRSLGCKIALISLLDENRQWFKAKCGLSIDETPIEQSFCAHAVEASELLVIPDATVDYRFSDNPLVVGPPYIRFYAGMPIYVSGGENVSNRIAIGTLCVIHDEPRSLSLKDTETLRDLAQLTEVCIRARVIAHTAKALAEDCEAAFSVINREQRQFRQAERMANIGSWRLSLTDQSVEWSAQVFVIHDLPPGTSPPLESALDFYPPQAKPVISAAVQRTIATGQPFDVETDFLTATGQMKRVRSMGEIELANGKPVAIIGVFQDITAAYHMTQSLQRIASVDELTQIANRAGCNAEIAHRFAQHKKNDRKSALMLIDLDGFKGINDHFGHQRGDDILQIVGNRLSASYLSSCFVGRLGGDEFVVVTDILSKEVELEHLVRRILADLRYCFEDGDQTLKMSGTIGVSWLDETVDSTSDWMRRADIALYKAKHNRRGTALIYGGADTIDVEPKSIRSTFHTATK